MTDHSNQTLTPAALSVGNDALELLARAKGSLEALLDSAQGRDDSRVYIGSAIANLHRDIQNFLWMDKPVGVAPIAPEMLAKIMGDA